MDALDELKQLKRREGLMNHEEVLLKVLQKYDEKGEEEEKRFKDETEKQVEEKFRHRRLNEEGEDGDNFD